MILAFADDSTMCVLDTLAQANSHCEAIDIAEQVFVFLDESGFVLKPVFTTRPQKARILSITTVCEGAFTLERTDEKREDLVRKLASGEIMVDSGPSSIRSLSDLRRAVPALFPA
jgi:hypothetical protein